MKRVLLYLMMLTCVVILSACTKKTTDSLSNTGDIASSGDALTGGVDTGLMDTVAVPPTTNTSQPAKQVSQVFQGQGTEPFWSFAFTGGVMVRSAPGDTGVVETLFTGIDQISISGGYILYSDGANMITLAIKSQTCSDGMSDVVYPKTVVATIGMQVYSGCVK